MCRRQQYAAACRATSRHRSKYSCLGAPLHSCRRPEPRAICSQACLPPPARSPQTMPMRQRLVPSASAVRYAFHACAVICTRSVAQRRRSDAANPG
eukprot:354150-Chlamydomonas_euryale.AAC.3